MAGTRRWCGRPRAALKLTAGAPKARPTYHGAMRVLGARTSASQPASGRPSTVDAASRRKPQKWVGSEMSRLLLGVQPSWSFPSVLGEQADRATRLRPGFLESGPPRGIAVKRSPFIPGVRIVRGDDLLIEKAIQSTTQPTAIILLLATGYGLCAVRQGNH